MGEENQKQKWYKSPAITMPILFLFAFITLGFSKYAIPGQTSLTDGNDFFLIISVIQIAVLVLPCVFYYLVKGRRLATPMFISPLKPSHILFTIYTLLLFISGTILIKYIYYVLGVPAASLKGYFVNLTSGGSNYNMIGIIISLIIIPAVCEELFFRGVMLSEYRGYGSVNAVLISALCFAMFHFSIQDFPIYLFSGIILGFITVTTRSVISSILIHLTSNLLSVFVSDLFLRMTIQKSGKFFVGFVIIVFFGLSVLFVISKLEHIYYSYAEKPPITTLPPRSFPNISKVFFSPSFIILIVIFLLTAVLT